MIDLLEHQAEFIYSDEVHTGIIGGFRSGKSHAGAIKTIKKKFEYFGINVAYYLPTYGLIKDIAYPKFSKLLIEMELPFKLNKSDHEIITDYGKIIFRSMDNPDSIIGYEVGYSLIDEADILPLKHMESAFTKIVSRLSVPLPDNKANSLDFVSTPEGFNFMHKFFVKEKMQGKKLIKASTYGNPFISKSYIETIKMTYTEEQLQAYLNGDFVNIAKGTVYKSYKREKYNTSRIALENEPLYIGVDFNIEKMSAIVYVIDGGAMYAVDQIINKYDTADLANAIRDAYPNNPIEINPDASCRARNSAGLSDYDILIDEKYNFNVNVRRKNPEISHRIRAVNKSFEIGKLFVNLEKCPDLADALEQQAYDKGLPDKKSGVDHVLDAAGYAVVEQIYHSGMD